MLRRKFPDVRQFIAGFLTLVLSNYYVFGADLSTTESSGNTLGENLALGKDGTSSSNQADYTAGKAFDGNATSRWGSDFTDNEWIYVDLGNEYLVDRVILNWENAFGEEYSVDVSSDASGWNEVAHVYDGIKENRVIVFPATQCRYVRMRGIVRGTSYGYSLYEFEVYGNELPEDYSLWAYSERIYLNTSESGADVNETINNFPVLVRLDQDNFNFDDALPTGDDIRFAASDGRPLSYEIEQWDRAAMRAAVWVKVPQISGNENNQYIMIYWGNGEAVDRSNSNSVFGAENNFCGVWHMEGVGDATANKNNAVKASDGSPEDITGIIGNAMNFDGNNDHLIVSDNASIDLGSTFSVSGWFQYGKSTAPSGWLRMISKKSAWDAATGYEITMQNGDNDAIEALASGSSAYKPENAVTSWSDRGWEYITVTFNGTNVSVYTNGALIGSGSVTSVSDNNNPLVFGNNSALTESRFIGKMDEIRVQGGIPSANWIKLCFENQKENQTLVEFGDKNIPTLTAEPLSETEILLGWIYNGLADYYVLEGLNNTPDCDDPECLSWQELYGGNSMEYTHTGLSCNTSWIYRIKAENGEYSNEIGATTLECTSINPPENLTATPISASSVEISWSAVGAGDANYILEVRMPDIQCQAFDVCDFQEVYNGYDVVYIHNGLPCNTQWEYRIKGVIAGNLESAWSDTKSATTQECVIASPTNLSSDNSVPEQISLTWVDNAENESGYKLFRKGEIEQKFIIVTAQLPANTASYIDVNLECNTSYKYYVVAYNNQEESGISNIVDVATLYCGAENPSSNMVNLIGMVLDTEGKPVTGRKPASAKLYSSREDSRDPIYEEAFFDVPVKNGFISLNIGQSGDVVSVIRSNASIYYDIVVDGISIFSNDLQPLTASPYSIKNSFNLHGTGSPVGIVSAPVGASYVDTQNRDLYMKHGGSDEDWVKVGD